MLSHFFHSPLSLGVAQTVLVSLCVLGVLLVAQAMDVHVGWETLVGLARGIVQIVLVGYLLVAVLKGPVVVGALLVIGMVVAAAFTAARRAKTVPGALHICLYSIAIGSVAVIGPMCLLGVIDTKMIALIPVASMIVAGNMTTCAQALERFASEIGSHTGFIEAALALGADSRETVRPYTQAAAVASLIPRIDSLRSLGIVWIPGLMAGMLLSGSNPVFSALYQFVILAMMYASSAITILTALRLVQPAVFTAAGQLSFSPTLQTRR